MNISKLPESDNVTEGALVVLSIDVEIVLSLAFAEIEISDNDADAVELSASAAATILVDSFFRLLVISQTKHLIKSYIQ
jgi:hypothetical protein